MWLASQKKEKTSSHSRSPRAAVKSKYRIWGEEGVLQTVELEDGEKVSSYGVVPYAFAPNIGKERKYLCFIVVGLSPKSLSIYTGHGKSQ